MAYTITQEDIAVLHQGEIKYYVKVDLCDASFKILDSLEGISTTGGLQVSNSSLQRRTYTCDFVITDSSFDVGKDKKIWVDKRLRVYYGVYSLRQKEILWYRIGTFAYVNVTTNINQTSNTISLTCADLMALYDGTLNGQIGGYGSANTDDENVAAGLKIPAGEDMRASIIALLNDAGITSYSVEEMNKEIPYDMEFSTGVTYAQVWQDIRDLYDTWEFFFDVDGMFIWRTIPNCKDDPVVMTSDLWDGLVISEAANESFSGIYNVTEVWGKVLELGDYDRYTEDCTYSDNVYRVNFSEYEEWSDIDDLTQIAIKINAANEDGPYFSVNGYDPIPIVDGNGDPLTAGTLKADTAYVFRYRRITVDEDMNLIAKLFLLGQYQCYGRYEETSEECPYSTTNLGYQILRAEDYTGLSDDAACFNQAEYDTYQTTVMMDTITLSCVLIPWIDVNWKIEYTRKDNGETNQYIIKDYSWNIGDGTMSITLYKFLEDFEFVYNRKYGSE